MAYIVLQIMNYKISLIVLVICFASCSKKDSFKYSYLNEKMNEEMTVCFADSRAMEYEKAANGRQGSTSYTEHGMVYEDKAEVTLRKSDILLELDIREGSWGGHHWVNNTSKDDRVNACKQLCFDNIRKLATFLSCDPKLIVVEWQCMDGNVQGTVTGGEALAAWNAEQAGTGQPATRPESKSEGSDKPQPESEGRSQ